MNLEQGKWAQERMLRNRPKEKEMNGVADQEGVTSQRLMSERPLATEICGKPTGVTHPNLGKKQAGKPPQKRKHKELNGENYLANINVLYYNRLQHKRASIMCK